MYFLVMSPYFLVMSLYYYFFKPSAYGRGLGVPAFLKLLWFAHWYACVCLSVCPPPRALITSGVIWCNIGHVRLVKQVLWLSSAFNYFI